MPYATRSGCSMRTLLLLVVAGWLFSVSPAASQIGAGETLLEVHFEGLQTLTPETLQFYLGLTEGEPFDIELFNNKVHDLWDRQLIDDLKVSAQQGDAGLILTVTVTERPTLRSVEYEGLKRLKRADISDKIAEEKIRVREGDALNMGELYRLKAAIEELYADKGFRLAEATFSIEEVSAADRRVFFNIDEGDKVRVEDVDFEGNTVFKDRRLRWSMKETKQSNIVTKLMKKDLYDPVKMDEDLDKVRQLYKKAGYKNVVLGEPKVEVLPTRPNAPSPQEQKRRLFITVPIEEGDRWKLGTITIEGSERFSAEILERQFEKPSGGWLRQNVIDKGIEAINEIYSNTGHLFAQVNTELVERPDQVADLIVHVDEGDQFRIRRIEFEGNTKTKDKVIRREMAVQEGVVMSTGALRNSLLRLQQMEFFKVDESDPVGFDIDQEESFVDLTIKGEEGDRTELLFGGGFSEIDGFFFQGQFRTRNFLGRGETLGLNAQIGARQDIFDISYQIPWFLDRPQSIGANIFVRRLDYSLLTGQDFVTDSRGGSITYGRNLGLFGSANITFTRYESDETRREYTVDGELLQQELQREVSMVRLGLTRDRRDSRLQPTVGTRYSFFVDYAGGVLGGNTNFVRPRAQFSKHIPVTKERFQTSWAFNVDAGLIEPIDDTELFFNDRFYLGGENSVRGFRYRSIWVRDPQGNTVTDAFGFPLGGTRSLQLNTEFIFVIKGPFRFIAFVDGGKVFGNDEGFSMDNFRMSVGGELQVNVPMLGAPIRFIFSENVSPLPDDRFETFQFSIGPSF
jgi:outer membrane protein insertion porin family